MQLMLLIYGDPAAAEGAGEPPAHAFPDWPEATRALAEAGVLVAGDGLQPVSEAASVRHRAGDELVTDGPFAETKEALLGYYLLDVPDRHTALGWAARMPMVHWGTVEVRAIMESPASANLFTGNAAGSA